MQAEAVKLPDMSFKGCYSAGGPWSNPNLVRQASAGWLARDWNPQPPPWPKQHLVLTSREGTTVSPIPRENVANRPALLDLMVCRSLELPPAQLFQTLLQLAVANLTWASVQRGPSDITLPLMRAEVVCVAGSSTQGCSSSGFLCSSSSAEGASTQPAERDDRTVEWPALVTGLRPCSKWPLPSKPSMASKALDKSIPLSFSILATEIMKSEHMQSRTFPQTK